MQAINIPNCVLRTVFIFETTPLIQQSQHEPTNRYRICETLAGLVIINANDKSLYVHRPTKITTSPAIIKI